MNNIEKMPVISSPIPYEGQVLSLDGKKKVESKRERSIQNPRDRMNFTSKSLDFDPKSAFTAFQIKFSLFKLKINAARNKLSFGLYFCSFLSKSSNETRKTLLNEIKSLENRLCKEVKELYGESVKAELAIVRQKGWDCDGPSILKIKDLRGVRKGLTDLWNEGVKESLINKPKEVSSSSGKRWECYEDNWTYWMSMPELPNGIKQDFAFAVVNTDGAFDPSYPVFTSPWTSDASLAIGGWNNSQSEMPSWGTNGFYTLVESIDPDSTEPSSQESNFISSIDTSLKAGNGAWTSVCLDFENYGDDLANSPGKYTKLIKDVYKFLEENHPGVKLKMCMSPNAQNRRYFDLKDLLTSCPNLTFQLMCYDYALGQAGTTRVIPNDAVYGPEYDYINGTSQETIQTDLLTLFKGDGTDQNPPVPQNRVYLGVPEYGIIYNLNAEDCAAPSDVLAKINNNWSLRANEWNPYGSDNGQITNEQILSSLGGSWTPSETCGWVTLVDNWGKTYYYNQSMQQIIAATPPDSLDELMGDFVRKNYPDVLGFFGWEAIGDNAGKSVQTFMNQFESFSTSLSTKAYHIFRHCMQRLIQTFNQFLGIKPLTGEELAKRMRSGSTSVGESCYLDMGILYGQWVYSNAIIWWPEPVSIDQTKVDEFLGEFFEQLKRDGVSDLRYSFEQMCDIFNIPSHVEGPWSDPISLIYFDNFPVGTSGRNFLEYMCDRSVEQGFSNTMSFGGVAAAGSDWVLPGDGVTCANTFVQFMKDANIQSVDFDVEGPDAITQVQTDNSKAFFTSLKEQQAARGGKSTITLIGDINQKPEELFNPFDSYFDGVSLMLYSTDQYYIDADNETWGLRTWESAVGNDPSKLSIGFFDKIAYEDPSSSAGKTYEVSGTRGQAAAQVYMQAAADLGVPLDEFSPPFWWTDDPTSLPDNTILEDFYESLGKQVEANPTLTKSDTIRDFIKNKTEFSPSDKKFYIALGKLAGKKKKTPLTKNNHTRREKKLPWKDSWVLGKNYWTLNSPSIPMVEATIIPDDIEPSAPPLEFEPSAPLLEETLNPSAPPFES